MNDPGVDGPIGRAAQDVEKDPQDNEPEYGNEEGQDFLGPSRWWFASTACPLIAGTFGPMANAFSICALVESWRLYIPPGSDEAHGHAVQDPRWLISINSLSLACALIANLFLLLNMARRARFAIAQPVTIVGFLLSSALLIALVSVASSPTFRIEPTSEHALAQAFYYAIMAAAIYFIISALMALTVVGAIRGHYPKEFRLTMAQRTLMLQTISFMMYLLLGALVFGRIEGWYFLDAVYWADFTLLTVGIGDYAPTTHLGRSLLFPFAIGGVVSVGLIVGSIRSLVLDRGKHKLKARFTEKKREAILSTVDMDQRTIKIGHFKRVAFSQKGLSEAQRREQEFLVMRQVQYHAQRLRRWTALIVSTLAAITLSLIGAVVFWRSEQPQGWSYFEAFYFSYVSLLTIGYGDISPTSNAGKAFFVFWSMLAVPTLTILISNMSDTIVKVFRDLVIWVGTFTVLPGERGMKEVALEALASLRSFMRSQTHEDGLLSGTTKTVAKIDRVTTDRLTVIFQRDESNYAEEAGEHGHNLERDIHFHNFVLASEIRKLMRDADASPPKQYSYGEWAYFLRLIGQDETDVRHHRNPLAHRNNHKRSDLGKAGQSDGLDGKELKWSWLGVRSPLLGNRSEAEWLLERMTLMLENQLHDLHSTTRITTIVAS